MNKKNINKTIQKYAHDYRDMKMSEKKLTMMFETFLIEILNDIERIEYNPFVEGCGLEDRNITDRYEAMEYGWEQVMIKVKDLLLTK